MSKLFEVDAYLKEFKAKITGIAKDENRIELDRQHFMQKVVVNLEIQGQ